MQLSKNFTLEELVRSDTAKEKGIENEPGKREIEALRQIAINVLQPIRDQFGRTRVTSGYRSPALSVAVGSTVTSQHTRGEAVDFYCTDTPMDQVLGWIVDKSDLPFDQIIDEIDVLGIIHISYKHNRREILKQTSRNRSYVVHPKYKARGPTVPGGDVAMVNTALLNLRESAGGPIITTLSQGTLIETYGSYGDWDQVKVNGFLSNKYIKS